MRADKRCCGFGHRGCVEWLGELPHEPTRERIANGARADLIAVALRSRAEPRVKARRRVNNVEDADVLRQLRIERSNNGLGGMREGDAGAGDLAKRMNARVGPPRTVYRHWRAFEPGQCLFE